MMYKCSLYIYVIVALVIIRVNISCTHTNVAFIGGAYFH